jgi:hypothetical protein
LATGYCDFRRVDETRRAPEKTRVRRAYSDQYYGVVNEWTEMQ